MEHRRGYRHGSAPRTVLPVSDSTAPPASADRAQVIVEAVRLLHVNGAESERVEDRTHQIGTALDVEARADLGWSSSTIVVAEDGARAPESLPFDDPPTDLDLNRVMAVDAVIDQLASGDIDPEQARRDLHAAAELPPANVLLFALSCAFGGCALAVILGVRHPQTLVVIAASTVLGALARRHLAHLGADNYWQVGAAGVLAGLGGSVSAALGLSSPLGLAAVCPCMVLVPGPHLLKGALDLGSLRIELGIARLTFASISLLAITSGLLIGLWGGRADLVTDPAGRAVPLWVDVPAAGLVAVCYGVFYSAPLRILAWPFVVGMAAHALRWITLEVWGAEAWVGAGVACLLVGTVLYPVTIRQGLPFSAVGFASVVSLMPGVLVFRALGGLAQLQTATGERAQDLVLDTMKNLDGAVLTILSMAVGFLLPFAFWRKLLVSLSSPRQQAPR